MKSIQKTITVVLLLVSFTTVYAQDGYEDPYGANKRSGVTGYGRRRNMPMRDISKLPKKEQDKIREETAAKTIEKLNKELHLDELQLIVITKVITENQKKQTAIASGDDSEEAKIAEMNASLVNTDREIMSYLNKDQKEKFKVLIEERIRKLEALQDLR
ncbi:hypothetical protein FSS13T_20470 [Flavobacterium saliperosum S13]|uniref:LTXXQ motif family protein n=2 Tax=Flavobacterium saliperosum TaxID=329186 RepID=A0A1G4VRP4_9FLAO|nr:hypothetical protein [Flavobacterium saliperosum]ESU24077.1 hypothetical protein FSS13T_20470 [Flavobacterium saliperosum S13]SCX10859.1 hypothetical protein SAMN02927925_01654 [Flavobacterium saliperosum]